MDGRQSKILSKLLNNTKNKKKKAWFVVNDVPQAASIASTKRQNKNSSRRVAVLNKLFMKNVTDLLAASQLGEQLVGLGIEISRVQICQNFHILNVFWFSTANNNEMLQIGERLAKIAGPLRHELSQLRLMGEVPRIAFVKDKKLAMLNEVERLLETADFGEDHVHNPYGQRVRNEFDPATAATDDCSSDVIPMRSDLFGVDRNAIMGRIERSLAKTKHAWEAYEVGATGSREGTLQMENSFESLRRITATEKKSEDVLKEFLAKRKLERKLKHKNELDALQLLELEQSEYREEWVNDNEHDVADSFDPLGYLDNKLDFIDQND